MFTKAFYDRANEFIENMPDDEFAVTFGSAGLAKDILATICKAQGIGGMQALALLDKYAEHGYTPAQVAQMAESGEWAKLRMETYHTACP